MMNYKKIADCGLMKLYMDGNESAFKVLVNRHRKEIYQRIYFIVRDKMMAEDILQDTFIRIFRSIRAGGYNEEGRFLSWAMTVARNLCLDYKRRAKGPKFLSYDILVPEFYSKQSTTIKCRVSESQLQQQIENILNKLPESQRAVIKYRHYDDMSFKEISMAMGTNVNTTMGRMRYGLQNLYRIIGSSRDTYQ